MPWVVEVEVAGGADVVVGRRGVLAALRVATMGAGIVVDESAVHFEVAAAAAAEEG
jgi:hypothetical protein